MRPFFLDTRRRRGRSAKPEELYNSTHISRSLSKKIPVLNSPWGRFFERPSDCQRWINQGHAVITDDGLMFTARFCAYARQQAVESNPVEFDDGVLRRWCRVRTSPASQLRPIAEVGPSKQVSKRRDKLIRPQYGRRIRLPRFFI